MTKQEAIATINRLVDRLDDEQARVVAGILEQMAAPQTAHRRWTAEELALIEQSKEDFRLGRTLSEEEYETEIAATLARLHAKHTSAV